MKEGTQMWAGVLRGGPGGPLVGRKARWVMASQHRTGNTACCTPPSSAAATWHIGKDLHAALAVAPSLTFGDIWSSMAEMRKSQRSLSHTCSSSSSQNTNSAV